MLSSGEKRDTAEPLLPQTIGTSTRFGTEKSAVLLLSSMVAITSTSERLTYKAMVDSVDPKFRYFLAQLLVCCYGALVLCIACKRLYSNQITEEMTEFPKRKFVLMGILDMCQNFLIIIPGQNVSGPLTVLLLQATVPFSMAFSTLFMHTSYERQHVLGAVLILLGVLLNLAPDLKGLAASNVASWSSFAYFLAAIPAALSATYKEVALRTQPVDLFYLNTWVIFFQFVLGILVSPVALKLLDQNIGGGFECLVGKHGCHQYTWALVLGFIISTVLLHLSITILLQQSLKSMYLSMTIGVPIAYIILELYQILVKKQHSNLVWDVVGIGIVVVGLIIYRLKQEPGCEIVAELVPERGADVMQSQVD